MFEKGDTRTLDSGKATCATGLASPRSWPRCPRCNLAARSRCRCSSLRAARTSARRSNTASAWRKRCARPAFRWKPCTTAPKATASTSTSIARRSTRSCSAFLDRNIGSAANATTAPQLHRQTAGHSAGPAVAKLTATRSIRGLRMFVKQVVGGRAARSAACWPAPTTSCRSRSSSAIAQYSATKISPDGALPRADGAAGRRHVARRAAHAGHAGDPHHAPDRRRERRRVLLGGAQSPDVHLGEELRHLRVAVRHRRVVRDGRRRRTSAHAGVLQRPGPPPGARRWSISTRCYSMLDPLPDDESKALMQLNDGSARRAQRRRGDRHGHRPAPGPGQGAARGLRNGARCVAPAAVRELRREQGRRSSATTSTPSCTASMAKTPGPASSTPQGRRAPHERGRHRRDGRIYALASDGGEPAAFGVLDPANDTFQSLYQDPVAGIHDFLYAADESTVVGVVTMAGAPHVELVDRQTSRRAGLRGAVEGVSGRTGRRHQRDPRRQEDRRERLQRHRSGPAVPVRPRQRQRPLPDEEPARVWIRRRWRMCVPFSFKARDGKTIYGYMTVPRGKSKGLPTIIHPHGGPIGIRDDWGFDWESQMLANRGYLVVQVNFRGSGGYGKALRGCRPWRMGPQDAGRPDRCHALGRRAGLRGSEADVHLWRELRRLRVADGRGQGAVACTSARSGYVGVYDLNMMFHKGDISERDSGQRYLKRTLGGDTPELRERSPSLPRRSHQGAGVPRRWPQGRARALPAHRGDARTR